MIRNDLDLSFWWIANLVIYVYLIWTLFILTEPLGQLWRTDTGTRCLETITAVIIQVFLFAAFIPVAVRLFRWLWLGKRFIVWLWWARCSAAVTLLTACTSRWDRDVLLFVLHPSVLEPDLHLFDKKIVRFKNIPNATSYIYVSNI